MLDKTVLWYTGSYKKRYHTDEWLTHYPSLNKEAIEWLANQGIVNFGIDAPSVDNPTDKTFPCHVVLERKSF